MVGLLAALKTYAEVALIIDYGAAQLPPHGADTLQALQHHKPVPLWHEPGETDITAHIRFAEVAAQLGAAACTLTPLADFLLAHGIANLALPLLPHPPTESALQRLLHRHQEAQHQLKGLETRDVFEVLRPHEVDGGAQPDPVTPEQQGAGTVTSDDQLRGQPPPQGVGGGGVRQMAQLDRVIRFHPCRLPPSEPEASASLQIFPLFRPPVRELCIYGGNTFQP
jgi:hypothetical protein